MLKKLLLPLLACLLLVSCGKADPFGGAEAFTSTIFAMDTVMEFRIYDGSDELLTEAAARVNGLAQKLSTTDARSEIRQLNETGSAVLSEDAAEIVEAALSYCAATEGSLDLSVYPLVRAWGFTTDRFQVPSDEEIAALLPLVDYRQIDFDPVSRKIALPEGMMIDLGSVAKGYTGAVLADLFTQKGVASGVLNLGGNVQVIGSRPDGSDWRVAVKDPITGGQFGVLSVSDCSVVTSGGYERSFQDEQGNVYWHIIDPSTGRPADSGVISATIIGKDGLGCDALSTAAFVMGAERTEAFWREHPAFDMVLVTEQNEVLLTPGLQDRFELAEDAPYTVRYFEP